MQKPSSRQDNVPAEDPLLEAATVAVIDIDQALWFGRPHSGSLDQVLLMPALFDSFSGETWRNLPGRLLLMLPGGAVWVLDTVGEQWNFLKLKAAAEILDSPILDQERCLLREKHLQDALGMPNLQLKYVTKNICDVHRWPTRQVTLSLLMEQATHKASGHPASLTSPTLESIEKSIALKLSLSLTAFFQAASPEVKKQVS